MALERGSILNQRYRIVDILGLGGMGSVYRAVDENLSVEVAVKENLFTTQEFAAQFKREAVILASLRHPNLPRVTDHFVIEGQGQYLVMDYIEGEDLRQRMDRLGQLDENEVIIIGAAICDALAYLGSRNPPIVHRDIKPGNVKITPLGEIYLVDFGLAKILEASQETATGARAMTPGYSPPEQYGTARTDQRSDIYSLGATLYAALTTYIPEDAMSRAMGQDRLTAIGQLCPQVSRRLAGVIEKAIQVRPDDRYQNAEDFERALLSAKGNSLSQPGEFRVTPPPPIAVSLSDQASESIATDQPSPPIRRPGSDPRTPPKIQSTSAVSRRGNSLLFLLFLVLVLVIAGLTIYTIQPNIFNLARDLILPPVPTSTFPPTATNTTSATEEPNSLPLVAAESSPTPTQSIPTHTSTPSASATTTLTATATLTPSPEPTVTGGSTGQIAFASDRTGIPQVYLLDMQTQETQQLTFIPEGACQPRWSPDGVRLLYISPCPSNQEQYVRGGIYLLDFNEPDRAPILLSDDLTGDYDPAWSPDGTKIAFTSLRVVNRPRIIILNLSDNSTTVLSETYSRDMQPTWSPDGSQIAFVSTQKGLMEIWTMSADGSNQQRFTYSTDGIDIYPHWSPKGDNILFTQYLTKAMVPRLVVGYFSEGEYTEIPIIQSLIPMREGRYSPDGLWLVFESWPEGRNHDIYIMSPNGINRTRLTDDPANDFDPDWRPALASPLP